MKKKTSPPKISHARFFNRARLPVPFCVLYARMRYPKEFEGDTDKSVYDKFRGTCRKASKYATDDVDVDVLTEAFLVFYGRMVQKD